MIVADLFAGVGGIDLGFIQTNKCEVSYANEFDRYAVETYEKNFNTFYCCSYAITLFVQKNTSKRSRFRNR